MAPAIISRASRGFRTLANAAITRAVLLPFVVQRALLMAFVCLSTYFIPAAHGWHALPRQPVLDPWLRWDSEYYLLAASEGYGPTMWRRPDAFFPLYPWLCRLFGLLLPLPLAALVVAHLGTVLALTCVYLLVRDAADERAARRGVWLLLVYPANYFLSAAYAEPISLAALSATVLAWQRGRPLLATAGAAGATLSRPISGLCLVLPYLAGWLWQSRRRRDFPWFLSGAALGVGILLLVHLAGSGNPLAFLHMSGVKTLADPQRLRRSPAPFWAILYDEGIGAKLMRRLLNWSALAFVAAAALHLFRRKESEFALLCLVAVGVPLAFQHTLLDAFAMLRYSLVAFPLYLALARWTEKEHTAFGVLSGFGALQVLLAVIFASWRWVE